MVYDSKIYKLVSNVPLAKLDEPVRLLDMTASEKLGVMLALSITIILGLFLNFYHPM